MLPSAARCWKRFGRVPGISVADFCTCAHVECTSVVRFVDRESLLMASPGQHVIPGRNVALTDCWVSRPECTVVHAVRPIEAHVADLCTWSSLFVFFLHILWKFSIFKKSLSEAFHVGLIKAVKLVYIDIYSHKSLLVSNIGAKVHRWYEIMLKCSKTYISLSV